VRDKVELRCYRSGRSKREKREPRRQFNVWSCCLRLWRQASPGERARER